ncbi:MAG: type II secretion system protein [Spirochaetaceae bacterium]|nr:type II secretion system protein [Myxococcales bacterium]MCB9722842.1 type II secretion system protein [Spirochaetaceae bacterium]
MRDPKRRTSTPPHPLRPDAGRARTPGRRAGFTLIELMAVVLLIALAMTTLAPQLSSSKQRLLKEASESIASSLEFARQRAVLTGVPHRLLIDLEEGGYRVEWWVTEDEAMAALGEEDAGGGFGNLLLGGLGGPTAAPDPDAPIDLHPPEHAARDYYPVPGTEAGRFTWLDDALYFVGVEGTSGWVEGGDAEIAFDADGTTEYTLLEIADADDHSITLEIEPLLDRVRRRNGPARS